MRRLDLQMRWGDPNLIPGALCPTQIWIILRFPDRSDDPLPVAGRRNVQLLDTKPRSNISSLTQQWPTVKPTICIGIFTNCIGIIIVELLMVISSHTDCKQQQVMMMVATGKAKQGKVAIRTFPKSPTQFARKTISKYDVSNAPPCVTCLHSQLVATLSVNQKLQVITQMARKLKTCG